MYDEHHDEFVLIIDIKESLHAELSYLWGRYNARDDDRFFSAADSSI
jgi:hypothetical protein